ncbi:MAG TPA: DUF2804 domain-containing protein [Pseudothermotoga sp.]|nr:DUF2804 domain-containing protein [Pseudothermotoga sp.]HOK83349.1 DUF2804 domain-containing protein [Pseudothermotoga sp.]HPP70174.1 DUF2804 domain-containing protein [Pseudothermotoga sp.]
MKRESVEITEPVDLCLKNGRLNPSALGWSRKPLIRCNLSDHIFRKKKWNYWAVFNQECLFSATISNLDYIGVVFCYFLDLKTKEFFEETVITPFGIGCNVPNGVDQSIVFSSKKMKVSFSERSGMTVLEASFTTSENKAVKANIEIFRANTESLNVVVPWSWWRFQYTSKQFCLRARGKISVDNKVYDLDSNKTFATLDLGRGVWKYSTFWNWASFAADYDDRTVLGANLGAGWTDGTGTNENAILINGRLNKIASDVVFQYDKHDLMKPWHIYSKDSDDVDLEFQPIYHRTAKTNLVLLYSRVHQMIGTFKGFVRGENREMYIIRDAIGWAEEHHARW